MRKWLLGLGAVVLVASYALAESRLPRGLVGFTTATTTGDAGVLAMTKLCQAEFPSSRMCRSAEVLATQTVPTLPEASAWVQPTLVPAATGTVPSIAADASGRNASPGALSCDGWANNGNDGLVVDQLGRFGLGTCATAYRVACCTAQPELLGDIDRDGTWPTRR